MFSAGDQPGQHGGRDQAGNGSEKRPRNSQRAALGLEQRRSIRNFRIEEEPVIEIAQENRNFPV